MMGVLEKGRDAMILVVEDEDEVRTMIANICADSAMK